MSLVVTAEPTTEPIALQEAKDHVRRIDGDDDDLIGKLIPAAREYCEAYLARTITSTSYRQSLGKWPRSGVIELGRPPLLSVQSVQYVDDGGSNQTLAATEYVVTSAREPGAVIRAHGVTWPTLRTDGVAEPVQINFTAGYSVVPQVIKQAMLLLIGHWYFNRESVITGVAAAKIPIAVESLLAKVSWGRYP